MEKNNIMITGTGSLIGQAIIKSIIKSSIKEQLCLIGCDYFEQTPGGYWCDKNYLLPDLLKPDQIENWKEAVFSIIEKEKIRAVLIGVDFELKYFAQMRDEAWEKYGCIIMVSDQMVIDIGNDKYHTFQFLQKNGLRAPDTSLLEQVYNQELNPGSAQDIWYPVVIKPRIGARSRGVSLIKDANAFRIAADACTGKGYIVQQAVGSIETEYTCGLLYWDGKYQNSIILKRTLKEGNTAIAEFHGNREIKILEYIREIGDALIPFGSCNLQLRVDGEGNPYLFEVNPRFSGTTYMRALFGYNEVEYILCKALAWELPGLEPKEGRAYRFYEERLVEVL